MNISENAKRSSSFGNFTTNFLSKLNMETDLVNTAFVWEMYKRESGTINKEKMLKIECFACIEILVKQ